MFRFRLPFFVFCLSFVALLPFFAFSAPSEETATAEIDVLNQKIKEKQEKIKEIESTIEAYKKQITVKKTQAMSLSNQIAILDNHITQVNLDIEATKEKLETIELEVEALELGIRDKEEDITRQKKILAGLIRMIHQEDNKHMLEIVAAYDSFSDFYGGIRHIRTLEKNLNTSTKSLRLAQMDLAEKKTKAEQKQEAYASLADTLEERKKDFDSQVFAKEDLLVKTRSSELEYASLLQQLKAQYQAIESDISSIEREVRKRLEAQDVLDEAEGTFDGQLSWPSQSRYITAYFHDPNYPFRNVFEHSGIDIRAAHGTPIKAAGSGYVATAKHCTVSSCYNYVLIVHTGGISTVYGHLSNVTAVADQFVTRGDIIGYSGGTPGTVGAGPFRSEEHTSELQSQ